MIEARTVEHVKKLKPAFESGRLKQFIQALFEICENRQDFLDVHGALAFNATAYQEKIFKEFYTTNEMKEVDHSKALEKFRTDFNYLVPYYKGAIPSAENRKAVCVAIWKLCQDRINVDDAKRTMHVFSSAIIKLQVAMHVICPEVFNADNESQFTPMVLIDANA